MQLSLPRTRSQAASLIGSVFPDWLGEMFLGNSVTIPLILEGDGDAEVAAVNGMIVFPESALVTDRNIAPAKTRWTAVDVYLPKHWFLKRRIKAPRAARHKIYQIAILDLTRRTPFELEEVYTVLSPPIVKSESVEVFQWVINRSDITNLRIALERNQFVVRRVFILGEEGIGPVASFSQTQSSTTLWWRRGNLVTIGMATLLLFGATALSYRQASMQLREMRQVAEALRTEAVNARRSLEVDQDFSENRSDFVALFLKPRLSQGLRDLSTALPDSAWISDLTFHDGTMNLAGEIKGSAAKLVLALGSDTAFKNLELIGGVSRTSDGTEIFEIKLELRQGEHAPGEVAEKADPQPK